MTPDEKPAFVQIVAAVAATFRQEASEALLLGYWLGLEDLPLAKLKRGAVRAMRECRFLPSVAELRGLAGDLSPQDRATIAWEAVCKAMPEHAHYHTVDFDDPAVNAALRTMGGWEEFADRWEHEESKWLRQEFERTYVVYARRGVTVEEGAPLVGFYDRYNALNGYRYALSKPTRIETTLRPTSRLTRAPKIPALGVEPGLLENIGKESP